MSLIIDIAEAVKDAINAASFSQPFTAERRYRVDPKLTELGELKVYVVPVDLQPEDGSRAGEDQTAIVDVGILLKFPDGSDGAIVAQMDALMELPDEMKALFIRKLLTGVTGHVVGCLDAVAKPIYYADHIKGLGQFTSVVRLTFDVEASSA